MSELPVEIPRLRAFGTQFHTFGTSNVGQTGRTTRVEAGQTEQHFADLAPVPVPAAAVETGIDPDEVAADIDRTRGEARAEHDAVFLRAFEGDR